MGNEFKPDITLKGQKRRMYNIMSITKVYKVTCDHACSEKSSIACRTEVWGWRVYHLPGLYCLNYW